MDEVINLSAPGPAGTIPLRLYRPQGLDNRPQPGLIYLHGGGWVIGDLDTHDNVRRHLAEVCGGIIVAVDYRLAPEHPLPVGPEDAMQVIASWVKRCGDV